MTRRTLALAVVLLLASSTAARAQRTAALVIAIPAWILTAAAITNGCIYDTDGAVDEGYARDGWYLGAGGAYNVEDFPTALGGDDAFGASGRVGYRCHPNLSVEAQYDWFAFPVVGSDVDGFDITGNGKVYLPLLGKRLQPFLVSGFGGFDTDNRQADFVIRLGGGVDYYLTHNLVVSVDTVYLQPYQNVADFQHISIGFGVQYRF